MKDSTQIISIEEHKKYLENNFLDIYIYKHEEMYVNHKNNFEYKHGNNFNDRAQKVS